MWKIKFEIISPSGETVDKQELIGPTIGMMIRVTMQYLLNLGPY